MCERKCRVKRNKDPVNWVAWKLKQESRLTVDVVLREYNEYVRKMQNIS